MPRANRERLSLLAWGSRFADALDPSLQLIQRVSGLCDTRRAARSSRRRMISFFGILGSGAHTFSLLVFLSSY
jgi:hypothetical protein